MQRHETFEVEELAPYFINTVRDIKPNIEQLRNNSDFQRFRIFLEEVEVDSNRKNQRFFRRVLLEISILNQLNRESEAKYGSISMHFFLLIAKNMKEKHHILPMITFLLDLSNM